MEIIKLILKNNSLSITSENIKHNKDINTNVKINDTLLYTLTFIKHNKETIKEIINLNEITETIYEDYEIFNTLNSILNTPNITFLTKESLPSKTCNILINKDNLKKIKCYFIPSDYVHILAKKNVTIILNNDYKFTIDFINSNGFKNLKSIYYKKIITFYKEEDVYDNFEIFLKVNTNLKVIHLYFYSKKVITYITEELTKYKETEVNILIHLNDFNKDTINKDISYLKDVNKKFNKKEKKIRIIYSNYVFKSNIFKELTFNVIKLSIILIMYLGFILLISNKYHEYLALIELRKLEMALISNEEIVDNIDEVDDTIEEVIEDPIEEPIIEEPPKYINYYANIPTSFDKLLEINRNVKGWIKVNNTLVNYPVLQAEYNEFYNTHDIYDREVITGWIYMDARNNSKDLDQNTIIYGHNLISGYMFGDLKSMTNYNYYTNPENKYITFNTLDKEMKWEIFSIYRTDYTTDYLQTNFFNDEQYTDFINMIKDRSIYNYYVDVTSTDKILTLSTCSGSSRRLVIHAKLVK